MFSLPAFLFLPKDRKGDFTLVHAGVRGIKYTFATLKEIWERKEPGKFLFAYLIFEDGVNTVIVFSSIFAATTLGFRPQELIVLYLIVQATALFGSLVMAKPIDSWGPKKVVVLSLLMWSSVAILAYFIQTKTHFWMLASLAGLGLGQSRQVHGPFIPSYPGRKGSRIFWRLFLVGKSSAILGPLVFGYIRQHLQSKACYTFSSCIFLMV